MEVVTVSVRSESDIGHARREAARVACDIGFETNTVEEISLVVTELATNLVRHQTIDGAITISRPVDGTRTGIEVIAKDHGPGIASPHLATLDHWSTNGTLGCGLGAVQRLMDDFDIQSCRMEAPAKVCEPLVGTRITTRKWLAVPRQSQRFAYCIQSRPCPGETANGDMAYVNEDDQGLLVAVADGLGHGPKAAVASQAAIAHIQKNSNKPIELLQRELHKVLSGTRGAAVTLARLYMPERRFTHIGVGNVATRVYPVGSSQLVTLPGVVGMGAMSLPRLNSMAWPEEGTLIVYSDGLSSNWDPSATCLDWTESVTAIGHKLMKTFARSNDDATVVVARENL